MCLVELKTQGVYPYSSDWIILGDLYLIRELEDRNKPRGELNEMFLFSEAINTLSLNEILPKDKHPIFMHSSICFIS